MVIQYMMGHYSESSSGGDPSMVVIRPLKSFTNNVTFPVLPLKTRQHMTKNIHVIVHCSSVNQLIFDNEFPWTNNGDILRNEETSMCVVRGQVKLGAHSVAVKDVSERISVYVYAICKFCGTSYMFPAGMWSREYYPCLFCSTLGIHGCLKRLFINFLTIISYFTSQEVRNPVHASNQEC